ncbi:MAG: DUF3089 domain-containing protein [Pseudomonadales bacterium]|nr:DUF3089 domain-containing protein [Pseudomonadales bacterium]
MSNRQRNWLIGFTGLILLVAALSFSGLLNRAMLQLFVLYKGPDGEFDPARTAPAPDYRLQENWAALPDKSDPADLTPAGIPATTIQGEAPADVFFIHPTGYLSGASWTSPMNKDSAAEENTQWMLANQASAYNDCCNVYAPRYREATIFTYFEDEAVRQQVLGFAYQDVLTAFEYFLSHHNEGRPFIIASHSQGTHHAKRLLKERIDGTALADRMVAAYIIGGVMDELSDRWFASMPGIQPCLTATATRCVIHWDTYIEGTSGIRRRENSLCTNPLTWRVDEEPAAAELNLGAVPIDIPYNLSFEKDNQPAGVSFTSLPAPLPGQTGAVCRDSTLFVPLQKRWGKGSAAAEGSYHGLDYALFYMNIRHNATQRVSAWLAQHPQS